MNRAPTHIGVKDDLSLLLTKESLRASSPKRHGVVERVAFGAELRASRRAPHLDQLRKTDKSHSGPI